MHVTILLAWHYFNIHVTILLAWHYFNINVTILLACHYFNIHVTLSLALFQQTCHYSLSLASCGGIKLISSAKCTWMIMERIFEEKNQIQILIWSTIKNLYLRWCFFHLCRYYINIIFELQL
jgi:hypothetical protein